jgi:hypothetical protein
MYMDIQHLFLYPLMQIMLQDSTLEKGMFLYLHDFNIENLKKKKIIFSQSALWNVSYSLSLSVYF